MTTPRFHTSPLNFASVSAIENVMFHVLGDALCDMRVIDTTAAVCVAASARCDVFCEIMFERRTSDMRNNN
jgi:hypothetical protein